MQCNEMQPGCCLGAVQPVQCNQCNATSAMHCTTMQSVQNIHPFCFQCSCCHSAMQRTAIWTKVYLCQSLEHIARLVSRQMPNQCRYRAECSSILPSAIMLKSGFLRQTIILNTLICFCATKNVELAILEESFREYSCDHCLVTSGKEVW